MNTTAPSTWRRKLFQRPILLSAVIFIVALLPRLTAIGRYITPDELIWVYRSLNFREAIRAGIWADTLLAGHPGVITMWLGTIGTSIQLFLNPADQEIYRWITQLAWLTPDNMTAFQQLNVFLTSGRLTVAIVNCLGIVVVFWMARRILGDLFALLVTSFLILDPFLAGLSGILHVDGLVTTLATISLLSLVLSLTTENKEDQQWLPMLCAAISGIMAALAVLAKTPALLLVPFTGMILFLSLWRNRQKPFRDRLMDVIFLGVIWIGSFLVVLFLVFPALWSSPLQVFEITSSSANRHLGQALRPTFFMGQVAFDHGLSFYPIVLAWRMGPLVMIGLFISIVLIFQQKWRDQLPKFLMLILILWIGLFLIGIALTAKKFDRYALPVIPALALLAAVGWVVWLRSPGRAKRILFTSLIILQFVYLIFVLPYPLAGYNLLLGGPFSAQYIMPIGWGEGISSAGSWLSEETDAGIKSAISGIAPSLAPFFAGETLLSGEDSYETADYIIVTANSRQVNPTGVSQSTQGLDLLEVIRYGGLKQSWIYANSSPQTENTELIELTKPVTFGPHMQLLSKSLSGREDELWFSARWDRHQSDDRFQVKLKLLDYNGHEWSYLETALLNEVYFFPENWGPEETPIITYRLRLPPAIPPGDYNLELSLVDGTTGSQQPVLADDGSFEGVSYGAGILTVTGPDTPVDVKDLDMSTAANVGWNDDSLLLLGHDELPEHIVSGGELTVDLYWQAAKPLPAGMQVAFQIADEEPIYQPLSRYDSGSWQPGTIIQEKYRLLIPATLGDDEASLSLRPSLTTREPLEGQDYALGDVVIQATDRLFTLPEHIAVPLTAVFEPGITLRGVEPADAEISSGDIFELLLYWQAESPTEEPVTAFVHLVDDRGNILAQMDRWPGGLPSNIWAEDQVIIDAYDIELPREIEPGTYQIVVGLYMAETGKRFPVLDTAGNPIADDAVLLPVTVNVRP